MSSFQFVGNIANNLPQYSSDVGLIQFGETIDGTFHGIAYHRATVNHGNALYHYFPSVLFNFLEQTLMTINREVPPHIDNEITWVINVYLETNNCLTQFYELPDNPSTFQIRNQTNGCIFNNEGLIPADSFVANVGDIYILDVSKPHAVLPLEPGPIHRSAICYQSRALLYEQFIAFLEIWRTGKLGTLQNVSPLLEELGIGL